MPNMETTETQAHDAFTLVKLGAIRQVLDDHHIRIIGNKLTDDTLITIWQGAKVEPHTRFFHQRALCSMGSFSYTHGRVFNGLSIGRYCSIASNIRLFGATHYTDWIGTSSLFYDRKFTDSDLPLRFADRARNRTIIGNDVWIGSDVALARNIRIGDGAVIATGSVVLRDVPPFAVVAGIPAKVKKLRFSEQVIERIQRLAWWDYHIDSFKGCEPSKPEHFLNKLEQTIADGNRAIQKYRPQALLANDLIKLDKSM